MRVIDSVVDVLIIGGGPAGLAAALALCRLNHNAVVIDSGDYRNKAAREMHMVSTWDHCTPEEFRAAARSELLTRYPDQCTFVDSNVLAITPLPSDADAGFEVRIAGDDSRRGRKVVLATGSRDLLPCIDGIDACWGSGIVHCLLCHGREHRGVGSVGILAIDSFAEPATLLRILRSCRQFASRIYFYTNGNSRAAAQLIETTSLVPGTCCVPTVIERLERADPEDESVSGVRVVLEDGVAHDLDFVVYQPGTEQASSLPEELGIELDANGDMKLGAFQETSCPGIFAAGDCASKHKYVSISSAMGHMAGAGAAQQIQAERK